jgi:hypothetical protein
VEYFRILLQSNCGASVLDFIPQTGRDPPNVCLNRLNQVSRSVWSAVFFFVWVIFSCKQMLPPVSISPRVSFLDPKKFKENIKDE